MYVNDLEHLLARVHPAIARVAVTQAANDRMTLAVAVQAPVPDHPAVLAALERSRASLTPRDFTLDYRIEPPAAAGAP